MRITHVVRQFHPCVGGLERFTLDLSRHLVARGHTVRVVTLDRQFGRAERFPTHQWLDGIEIRRIPYWGWRGYPIAPTVLDHLADADVVHVHAVDYFADYLALTRPRHQKPLVLSTHGGFFHTTRLAALKDIFFQVVTRHTLAAYAAVVPSGPPDEARFRAIAPNNTTSFENAIDPRRFVGPPRAPRLGRLITVGRLAENKGLDRLIRAVAVAARHQPDLRLDIVGEDWGGLQPTLVQLAVELKVADRVEFHGLLDDAEVARLLAQAQWFVSAATYEGFGLAVVEAMAAGLPAILSDIPALAALAKPGDAAPHTELVDFNHAETAGARLAELTRRPIDLTEAMGRRASQAVQRYAWPAVVDRFEAIYHAAVATHSARPSSDAGGHTVRRRVLGVRVDDVTNDETVAMATELIERGKPAQIVTVNPEFVMAARRDLAFRRVIESAALAIPDGVGLRIATAWQGAALRERVAGVDTCRALAAVAARRGWSIYLLGAAPGVAELAAERLQSASPGLVIAGRHAGSPADAAASAIVEQIRASGARLLFVAYGAPAQDLWLARHLPATGATLGMGVGGAFDFISGRTPRAPGWIQSIGAEWLYRLIRQPWRWRRQLVLPVFLALAAREGWLARREKRRRA